MIGAPAIRAGDADAHRRRRHGEHEHGAIPAAAGAHRATGSATATLVDATVHDGLWCAIVRRPHGHPRRAGRRQARRQRARRRTSSRCDRHQRAIAAQEAGRFDDEIVPVSVPGRKGETVVTADEAPRPDTSLEALAKLQPGLPAGRRLVTAGNAPGITDGAAALVIGSEARPETGPRRWRESPATPRPPSPRMALRGADPRRCGGS